MKVIHNSSCPELQLQKEIVFLCRNALDKGAQERNRITSSEEWDKLRAKKLEVFKSVYPHALYDRRRPLNIRKVSEYEFDDFRIENVVFESLLGWEVNGTVYLPKQEGVYPGVVCPTGHSSKMYPNYQRSCQTIARNGYVVISFDPPGVAGEISFMNEHFKNGLIGYLTGFWSQTHFLADAMSALDYLETRSDVDKNAGFAMTGVSGGGLTTIFCSVLDERIKFSAPVCCLSMHSDIHLKELYTSCPEQFGPGYIKAGLDYVDYLCLMAPKHCLVVAGKNDEVFNYRTTISLFNEAKHIYNTVGAEENLEIFIDEDSGHAYTVKMANRVVQNLNRYIKHINTPVLCLEEKDMYYVEHEKLKCYPSNRVNMYSINRDEAIRLENSRCFPKGEEEKEKYLKARILEVLGLEDESFAPSDVVEEKEPPLRWFHNLQKIELKIKNDVSVPGLLLKRAECSVSSPALLFIDDRGKWEGFKQGGFLSCAGRFLNKGRTDLEPVILSIDFSGFGELEPEPAAYDLAGWNDIERILTYLSVASGKSIMGLGVRDALAALKYLESREDIDNKRIIIGGRGVGAIIAMHVSVIWGKAAGVIGMDMLSCYRVLAEEFPNTWPQMITISNILKFYDLPDIVEVLAHKRMLLINPCDAVRNSITDEKAGNLFHKALEKGAIIKCGMTGRNAEQCFTDFVLS